MNFDIKYVNPLFAEISNIMDIENTITDCVICMKRTNAKISWNSSINLKLNTKNNQFKLKVKLT